VCALADAERRRRVLLLASRPNDQHGLRHSVRPRVVRRPLDAIGAARGRGGPIPLRESATRRRMGRGRGGEEAGPPGVPDAGRDEDARVAHGLLRPLAHAVRSRRVASVQGMPGRLPARAPGAVGQACGLPPRNVGRPAGVLSLSAREFPAVRAGSGGDGDRVLPAGVGGILPGLAAAVSARRGAAGVPFPRDTGWSRSSDRTGAGARRTGMRTPRARPSRRCAC